MVTVQNREQGYRILLDEGENIKIFINDGANPVFNETVSPTKQGKVSFKFQESIFEE